MDLELRYRVRTADFREASYYALFMRKKNAFRVAAVVLIATFVYGVLCVNNVLPFEPVAVIPAAAYLIWVLLQLASAERAILRYSREKDSLINAEYTAKFRGKQFTIEIPDRGFRVTANTEQFDSAYELTHCFLLYVSAAQLFIVPTRDMSKEEAETLRVILTKELKERFYSLFSRRRK